MVDASALSQADSTSGAAGDLTLKIHGSLYNGQVIRLQSSKCTVGSDPRCTLRLRGPGIRPVHCLIVRGEERTVVRQWAPDTRLNGGTFIDSPLAPGDRLGVGRVEFEVLSDSPRSTLTPILPPPVDETVERTITLQEKLATLAGRLNLANGQGRQRTRRLIERLRTLQQSRLELENQTEQTDDQLEALDAQREKLDEERQTLRRQQQQWEEQLAANSSQLTERSELVQRQLADLEHRRQDANYEDERLAACRLEIEAERTRFEADWTARQTWVGEQAAAEARLVERRADLDALAQQIQQRQHEHQQAALERQQWLDARQAEVDEQAAGLRQQEIDVETQRAELLDELSQLELDRQTLTVQERDAAQHALDLNAEHQLAIEQQQLGLADERRAIDEHRLRIQAEHNQFQIERQKLAKELQKLARDSQELAADRQRFSDAQRQTAATTRTLVGDGEEHASALAQLEQERAAIDTQRQQLQTAIEDLDAQRHALTAEQERLLTEQLELEAGQQALEARRRELEAQSQQLAHEQEQLLAGRAQLESERSAWQAQVAETQRHLDQQTAALTQQIGKSEAQQQALARIQKSKKSTAATKEQLARQIVELDEQKAQLIADREHLAIERENLLSDKERLAAEHEEVTADRAHWAVERENLLADKERLAAEHEQLTADREQFTGEQQRWSAELSSIQEEQNERQRQLDAQQTQGEEEAQKLVADRAAFDHLQSEFEAQYVEWDAQRSEMPAMHALAAEPFERAAPLEMESATTDDVVLHELYQTSATDEAGESEWTPAPETEAAESNVDIFARLRGMALLKEEPSTSAASDVSDDGSTTSEADESVAEITLLEEIPEEPDTTDEAFTMNQISEAESGIESESAANAEPTASTGEEESIDDYMARLLNRVRGGKEGDARPAAPRPAVEKPAPAPTPEPTSIATVEEPKQPDFEQHPDPDEVPQMLTKRAATGLSSELSSSLQKMRELANMTARTAIHKHVHGRSKSFAKNSIFAGIGSLAVSGGLVVWSGLQVGPILYGAGALLVMGLGCLTHAAFVVRSTSQTSPGHHDDDASSHESESQTDATNN